MSGAFHRPYSARTHMVFVKQLIIAKRNTRVTGSHEVKTLIFERPASKLQRLVNAQ